MFTIGQSNNDQRVNTDTSIHFVALPLYTITVIADQIVNADFQL